MQDARMINKMNMTAVKVQVTEVTHQKTLSEKSSAGAEW